MVVNEMLHSALGVHIKAMLRLGASAGSFHTLDFQDHQKTG